ncbi:MAG: glycosyltransferase [Clostridia bacterium]|nr:glycosyltransferase [Clostridia bacterium]
MKICFLAPANNAHTIKWCKYFVAQGHHVDVISFIDSDIPGTTVHFIDTGTSANGSDKDKLKYLLKSATVRKIIKQLKPDIINAHYATSYGTVAALAGLKNYILSVWGSDIYEFPQKSFLHKALLKFSLFKAKYLFSTSKAMAEEASKYTNKTFYITPFGVNIDLFTPKMRDRNDTNFIIGTVKGLAPAYGIDVLLRSAALLKNEHPEIPLKIRIAGSGCCEKEYHSLAAKLNIENITTWLGFIPQEQAAKEWANMDVAVVCSNSESFGVSAVEAQSCGCPVIISDIPGLMEATKPGETSIVVPKKNEKAVADALFRLYNDATLRREMGIAGRDYVSKNYELNDCFNRIEMLFKTIANNSFSRC